jgi:DNA replication and repair protein RecF
MHLIELQVNQLRNLNAFQYHAHPKFNFIIGDNGSGKTSFLEAIYLLGVGHSFRCRENTPLINHENASLFVFGRLSNKDCLGVEKTRLGKTRVKANGVFCKTSSSLAFNMPMQVIYQDIFQIIDAGPSVRRTIIDWGLFHVKHDYLQLWQNYKRILKQRNTILRKNCDDEQLAVWDRQLSTTGELLHQNRQAYIETLVPIFNVILRELSELDIHLNYVRGWAQNEGCLLDCLIANRQKDRKRRVTQCGPHLADIQIKFSDTKVKHNLSRGQQKIILIALKLAQAQLLTKPCVYLFDDVAAELDVKNQEKVANLCLQTEGQFFFTAIDDTTLSPFRRSVDSKMFHVKHLV